LGLVPGTATAAPITSLYVFGDSLSDQGNAFILTNGFPPAPYAQRASNGPVAAERLAADLGVALAPAALGGTNYAVVGAATGLVQIPGTSIVTDNVSALTYNQVALFGTGLVSQVDRFLMTGPVIDRSGSEFLVWAGANDLSLNPSLPTAANAVTNISNSIQALYGAGARHFLVPNLPDLSLTPFGLAQSAGNRVALQGLSIFFDSLLASAMKGLSGAPGIDIKVFDTFSLLSAISASPGAYGFANASAPCLTGDLAVGGNVCATPDQYLFWDTLHPTAAGHRVLGDAFAAAVPEPATLSLCGVGLLASLAARRRRT
jgi:outer membrane lipase/esterase